MQPTDGAKSLLTPASLAELPDFRLGSTSVSPSRRIIAGPGGQADVEPRVMQVLVILAQSAGAVVTRETLFNRCWGGVYVGDDSLNRAIGAVRRLAAEVAAGSFEIETVPRTGYRLLGEVSQAEEESNERPARASLFPRRTVILGALGAAAGAGGLGVWAVRSREDRAFRALMDRGRQLLSYGDSSSDEDVRYFQRAAAIRPADARAQGLIAYAQAMKAEYGDPGGAGAAVQDAERAATAALGLDPAEANALLARTLLQRSMLDFAATEDRLRAILASAPDNIFVMRHLWNLLQSAGRSRDAFALVERAIAVEPLAAANNYPRAQLLWILGRNAEADRVIDRAMQYWPSHRFVRFARFMIYACTDRPRAALAMLDDEDKRPQNYTPEAVSLWRVSLAAFEQRTPERVAAARMANLQAAEQNPGLSNQAVLALSALGEIDAAFEIANGLLLFRRPAGPPPVGPAVQPPVKSTSWRFTPWLFIPPLAPFRADPRFGPLCDGIGLTEYWRKRGIEPDYRKTEG